MEHEVFVPFPPGTIREALRDPARVARGIHGFQPEPSDPDASGGPGEPPQGHPLTGRLRFRVGGSTITYRGTLYLSQRHAALTVDGEVAEARGSGTVKIAVEVGVGPAEGGSVLTFSGTVRPSGGGRLAEQDPEAVAAAGRRLLDRFAAELTDGLPAAEPDVVDDGAEPAEPLEESAAGLPEGVTVPESAAELDPLPEDLTDDDEPPAEAAHARRTMIGRSAEEVDHAPPRGRYAPVPTPDAVSGRLALRWAAPAAAALLASAVVVGRVLRRRR